MFVLYYILLLFVSTVFLYYYQNIFGVRGQPDTSLKKPLQC